MFRRRQDRLLREKVVSEVKVGCKCRLCAVSKEVWSHVILPFLDIDDLAHVALVCHSMMRSLSQTDVLKHLYRLHVLHRLEFGPKWLWLPDAYPLKLKVCDKCGCFCRAQTQVDRDSFLTCCYNPLRVLLIEESAGMAEVMTLMDKWSATVQHMRHHLESFGLHSLRVLIHTLHKYYDDLYEAMSNVRLNAAQLDLPVAFMEHYFLRKARARSRMMVEPGVSSRAVTPAATPRDFDLSVGDTLPKLYSPSAFQGLCRALPRIRRLTTFAGVGGIILWPNADATQIQPTSFSYLSLLPALADHKHLQRLDLSLKYDHCTDTMDDTCIPALRRVLETCPALEVLNLPRVNDAVVTAVLIYARERSTDCKLTHVRWDTSIKRPAASDDAECTKLVEAMVQLWRTPGSSMVHLCCPSRIRSWHAERLQQGVEQRHPTCHMDWSMFILELRRQVPLYYLKPYAALCEALLDAQVR